MKLNIEKDNLAKLNQLSVSIDAEEFDDGTGRLTICANAGSNGHLFVLHCITIDVPVIKFPPEQTRTVELPL